MPPVDHRGDAGLALHVGPALTADQRVDPQGAAGPDEPDRGDMRAARPDGGHPAGPLLGEERVELLGTHRDHPAPPLLSHHRFLLFSARDYSTAAPARAHYAITSRHG